MSIRKILILSLLLIVASAADSSDDHESLVRPFLEQYCYKCHGAEVQKSDRRFDTLTHSGVYRVSILASAHNQHHPYGKALNTNVNEPINMQIVTIISWTTITRLWP